MTSIVAGMGQPVRGNDFACEDPSFMWSNPAGVIHTQRIGDTLYFYMAVAYASTGDPSDDGGIAKYVSNGRYEIRDDQSVVALIAGRDNLKIIVASGKASFCNPEFKGCDFPDKEAHYSPSTANINTHIRPNARSPRRVFIYRHPEFLRWCFLHGMSGPKGRARAMP